MLKLLTKLSKDTKSDKIIETLYDSIHELIKIIKSKDTKTIKIINDLIYQSLLDYVHVSLKGTDEIDALKNKKDDRYFKVLISNTKLKIKLFILNCLTFYYESLLDPKESYLSLDFEFNQRQIAVMQLCFESPLSKVKWIWLTNPSEFSKEDTKIYIELMMANKNIHKILHGADSLDIPFLFHTYFEDDKKIAKQFMRKYIDTRFLCEYYRQSIDDGKKCAIYDALEYFKVINKKQFDNLNNTHDGMGPVQDISWSIHTLDKYSTKYAYYDVLFLRTFVQRIFTWAKQKTPDKYSFYIYIPVITRYVILEKRGITNISPRIKEQVDKVNNWKIKSRGKLFTLISIFSYILNKFKVYHIGFDYELLMSINYFRKNFSLIMKKIVYYLVFKHLIVYKSKDHIAEDHDKVKLMDLLEELYKEGYHKMIPLVNYIRQGVEKRLLKVYK